MDDSVEGDVPGKGVGEGAGGGGGENFEEDDQAFFEAAMRASLEQAQPAGKDEDDPLLAEALKVSTSCAESELMQTLYVAFHYEELVNEELLEQAQPIPVQSVFRFCVQL